MKHLVIIILGILILALTACTKEGKGGAASIEGKVKIRLIKETTLDTLTTYDAPDEDVYIIYGENLTYDDDVKTTYNGNFKFDYLYTGNYTVYVYSECTFLIESCPDETVALLENVTIEKARQAVDLGEIVINKYIK